MYFLCNSCLIGLSVIFPRSKLSDSLTISRSFGELSFGTLELGFNLDYLLSKPAYVSLILGLHLDSLWCLMCFPGSNDSSFLDICPHFVGIKEWVQDQFLKPYICEKCLYFTCPPCSSVHGIFQTRNTEVDCHSLLQGIFLNQGSNPCLLCLLHCGQILPIEPSGKFTKCWNVIK